MIEGLHETILYVENMGTEVEFYRDTLGLTVDYPTDHEDPSGVEWVAFDTGECTLALHAGGVDAEIEGSPEIVFEVDDIESARQTLIERGVDVGEIREVGPNIRVAGARDPEGNPFSIESIDRD